MYWFRGVWFGGFRSSMGTLILIYFTLAINKTVWYLEGWYEASLIWMSSDEEKKLNYRLSFPILSSCAISMVEWCCLLVDHFNYFAERWKINNIMDTMPYENFSFSLVQPLLFTLSFSFLLFRCHNFCKLYRTLMLETTIRCNIKFCKVCILWIMGRCCIH